MYCDTNPKDELCQQNAHSTSIMYFLTVAKSMAWPLPEVGEQPDPWNNGACMPPPQIRFHTGWDGEGGHNVVLIGSGRKTHWAWEEGGFSANWNLIPFQGLIHFPWVHENLHLKCHWCMFKLTDWTHGTCDGIFWRGKNSSTEFSRHCILIQGVAVDWASNKT